MGDKVGGRVGGWERKRRGEADIEMGRVRKKHPLPGRWAKGRAGGEACMGTDSKLQSGPGRQLAGGCAGRGGACSRGGVPRRSESWAATARRLASLPAACAARRPCARIVSYQPEQTHVLFVFIDKLHPFLLFFSILFYHLHFFSSFKAIISY